jgi:hypothetical protein
MKQFAAILLAVLLCVAALSACRKKEKPPDPSPAPSSSEEATEQPTEKETEPPTEPPTEPEPTPEEALSGLLDSAKEWDVTAIDAYLPEGSTIKSFVPAGFDSVVASLLSRTEYKLGDAVIDGDTATIEAELTAADAEKALDDAIADMLPKVALSKLTGKTVDYNALLDETIQGIDIAALPTSTTDATAYMIRGADGEWKLDAKDERNLPFLNAATGGAVDISKKLTDLAATLGFPIG